MIQLGVFSLWTGCHGFKLTRNSAMLFSSAIAHGRATLPFTELVTDNRGLEIADRLGWNTTSYSLHLEGFAPDYAKHVWFLGKLIAQQAQSQPFVHIDLDLLLFRPLPMRLTTAPIFAQSKDHPEPYHAEMNRQIASFVGVDPNSVPYNAGLLGWNDLVLMGDYCERSMYCALKAAKQFPNPDLGGCISIVCEQFLLGAMSRERRIKIETAIPIPNHHCKEDMRDVEFVHLWGASKDDPKWLERIEDRFAEDFPREYIHFIRGWKQMCAPSEPCTPLASDHCGPYPPPAIGHCHTLCTPTP